MPVLPLAARDKPRLGFSSTALHAGERPAASGPRPIVGPIHLSVGYEAQSAAELEAVLAGNAPGFAYARYGNPSTAALEEAIAQLECGQGAVAVASGMAALHAAALASDLERDDVILASRHIFYSTQQLFALVLERFGVVTHYADFTDLDEVRDTIRRVRPRVVFVEVVSNPLLRVIDVPSVVAIAKESDPAIVIVDATLVTPRLFRPLDAGADLVVHSSTKYLNGHGDVTGGLVVGSDEPRIKRLRDAAQLAGAVLGPFDAWLTLRGLKTLGLRMTQQCASAKRIAEYLRGHGAVARVHYPGLSDHAQHALAERLFDDGLGGAVIAIELRNAGREGVLRFIDALRLWCTAPTLGDVYSQVSYPAMAPYREGTVWAAACGITPNLVRLSVGIEDVDDLIADLDGALQH